MKLKNILLAFPFQFPLMFVMVFGVHSFVDLNAWWCTLIAYVLLALYDFGENVRRGE
jgi:hypothetical protein